MKRNDKYWIDLLSMLPLQGDEEIKGRKGWIMLTPNNLLIRLPVLLAKTKLF